MKEKMFFFEKMFETPQTRQMNWVKNVRKNPSDELFLFFFFENSESYSVFNYLHDSHSFFRAGRIDSEIFFGRGTVRQGY